MAEFDAVIRNGVVVTAADVVEADLGITDGVITALGRGLGLCSRKGPIAVGSDADLVVWDQDREVVHHPRPPALRLRPHALRGHARAWWPTVVFSRGEVIVEEGKLPATPGRGRFLRCARPLPTLA